MYEVLQRCVSHSERVLDFQTALAHTKKMKPEDFTAMQLRYEEGLGELTGYRYQMCTFHDAWDACLRMELYYPDHPQYSKIVVRDYEGVLEIVEGAERCERSFIGLVLYLRDI